MEKIIILLSHLVCSFFIHVSAIVNYIFYNEISIAQKAITFITAIILLCADYYLCKRLSYGQCKWIHWFDLPLMIAPCGFVLYITLSKYIYYYKPYHFSFSEIMIIFVILLVEISILIERLKLIRFSAPAEKP